MPTVRFEDLTPDEQLQLKAQAASGGGGPAVGEIRDPYGARDIPPMLPFRQQWQRSQQNLVTSPVRAARDLGARPGGMAEKIAMGTSQALGVLTGGFQTPEGSALMLTGGAMGRLPMRAQAGIGSVVGAGTSAVTGGDIVGGGAEGLTMGAVGGLIRKVSQVTQRKAADSWALIQAIKKEVPWFEAILPASPKSPAASRIEPVMALRDPAVGEATMRQAYRGLHEKLVGALGANHPVEIPGASLKSPVVEEMTKTLGGRPLPPEMVARILEETESQALPVTKPLQQALQDLLVLKQQARKADPGPLGHATRDLAKRTEAAILKTVARSGSPELVTTYKDTMVQYGKAVDVLAILKDSRVIDSGLLGGKANLPNLHRFLIQNIEDYGKSHLPYLWHAATKGARAGDVETTFKVSSPRVWMGGATRVGEALPPLSLPRRFGTSPPTRPVRSGAVGSLPTATTLESIFAPPLEGE